MSLETFLSKVKEGNKNQEINLEQSLSKIAQTMSYSDSIEKLMQLTRASERDKERLSILYALNNGRLKSRVLKDYMFAYLSLANSKKGESRKELIEIVKANTPQIPKGFFAKIKDSFSFD